MPSRTCYQLMGVYKYHEYICTHLTTQPTSVILHRTYKDHIGNKCTLVCFNVSSLDDGNVARSVKIAIRRVALPVFYGVSLMLSSLIGRSQHNRGPIMFIL